MSALAELGMNLKENNMSKDQILSLLSHYQYDTPFSEDVKQATIKALQDLVFLRCDYNLNSNGEYYEQHANT